MPATSEDGRLWVPKVQELRKEVVDAVIKYLGPIHVTADSPPLGDNPAIVFRDSMLYRAQSVGYHIDLLKWQFSSFTQEAHTKLRTTPRDPSFLINCRSVLTFLSDDILFNAISMLDYVGNLVGCTLSGPNSQRLKWNGVVKAARDKQNPLANTAAAKMMLALHNEWVDKLHGVRSRIIHERITLGDGGQTITFREDSLVSTLSFQLPPVVVKPLPFLRRFSGNDGTVDLVIGAEQIALRAIDAATSVTTALLEDFGGRVIVGQSSTDVTKPPSNLERIGMHVTQQA